MGGKEWLLTPGQPGSLTLDGADWRLWSPDGSYIFGTRPGRLVETSIGGSGEVRDVRSLKGSPQDISQNGKQILMLGKGGISALALDGAEEENSHKVAIPTGESIYVPSFSPDGQWIVYLVRAKGSYGVYAQPIARPGLRTQIFAERGFPIWLKDGKEIAIANAAGVWSVKVDAAGAALRFGAPALLFSGLRLPAGTIISARLLAVSRDGSRFYFPQAAEQPDSGVIHIKMGF